VGIHDHVLFSLLHLSDDITEMLREDVNAKPAVPWVR
jgi:hypothetical protein